MDCFVFPSLYEGLGIVLIEAQANGLTCYTSKGRVPIDANLTGNVQYISLNQSPVAWADLITSSKQDERNDVSRLVKNEYDIRYSVKQLYTVYQGVL